ncbi:hypothetical protein M0R04_03495 [Candidatus Dojkabacteria bacterium]|jgi:hypothetical protein|nr:hypothetical protein [Candidatus Dojkabacteria bacterium]
MKIIKEIVRRVKNYEFHIPFDGKPTNIVERGKSVKPNTLLFVKEYKKAIETYNLVTELRCPLKEVREYVTRINGEYVTTGEILAERMVSGGLSVRKVLATRDGVLSFERLALGFLDILSEHQKEEVYSDMFGKVEDIDMATGVTINADALAIPCIYSNSKEKITGKFTVLGDASSVYSQKDLKEDYIGEIVYVGRFAYQDLITKILSLGAKAVVTFAANWEDLSDIPGRVYVVSGFGNIPYHEKYAKFFLSQKGLNVVYDANRLLWPDLGRYLLEENEELVSGNIKINNLVRVLGNDNLNRIGRVVDGSNGDGYYTVDFGDQQRGLFSEELLQPVKI